jgi:hypothetical protein
MSMISTPSLAPGARTLPIGLRVPEGNAYGWHRLHGNMAPLTEHPIYDPRVSLSGITCDENGVCQSDGIDSGGYVDTSTLVGVGPLAPGENYDPGSLAAILAASSAANPGAPVVVTSAGPNGTIQSQSMTPAQLTALINAGSTSLQKVIALTQGGSVLANGSIIGSQQAAQLAAAQSGLNITSAGLTGMLSSPMLPIAIMGIVAVMLLKK